MQGNKIQGGINCETQYDLERKSGKGVNGKPCMMSTW
jgi:hypothetical protein